MKFFLLRNIPGGLHKAVNGQARMAGMGLLFKIPYYMEYALPDNKQRLLNIH